MSIGPNFIAGSVAGGQLPQARGAELDRNSEEAAQQNGRPKEPISDEVCEPAQASRIDLV